PAAERVLVPGSHPAQLQRLEVPGLHVEPLLREGCAGAGEREQIDLARRAADECARAAAPLEKMLPDQQLRRLAHRRSTDSKARRKLVLRRDSRARRILAPANAFAQRVGQLAVER